MADEDEVEYGPEAEMLGAEIGISFRKLLASCDNYDEDMARMVVEKVFATLSYMQKSLDKVDNLEKELDEQKAKNQQLRQERIEQREVRKKLDQQAHVYEEYYSAELNEKIGTIQVLTDENKLLKHQLHKKENSSSDCKASLSEEDLVMKSKVHDLTEKIEKFRKQLIVKDQEFIGQTYEVKKMQQDIEKLSKENKGLSYKNKNMRSQVSVLVKENSVLEADVQNHQKECAELQEKLDMTIRENKDLSNEEDQRKLDMRSKVVIDLDDPNRPRFTLEEIRNIICERNYLKAKLSDMEDELSMRKSDLEDELSLRKSKSTNNSSSSLSSISTGADNEDLPVQGPINKEPDEKLYPDRKRLGIRRFFPSITWPKLV